MPGCVAPAQQIREGARRIEVSDVPSLWDELKLDAQPLGQLGTEGKVRLVELSATDKRRQASLIQLVGSIVPADLVHDLGQVRRSQSSQSIVLRI